MSIVAPDSIVVNTPIDRILDLFGSEAHGPNDNRWYTTRCPAHIDRNRSLSFRAIGEHDNNEGVVLHCFAGCARQEILTSLNLTEQEMHSRSPQDRRYTLKSKLTMIELAIDKHLHPNFLLNQGLEEATFTHSKDVKIPYYNSDGTLYDRYRERTHEKAKQGCIWNSGSSPLIPYGLHKIGDAQKAGYLMLVEGESDCWTLWYHGLPAMGFNPSIGM